MSSPKVDSRDRRVIYLFDVDGTLTAPRIAITEEMRAFMRLARGKAILGIVGGSDLSKQAEQLGHNLINEYDYVFSENGLVAYRDGKLIATQSIKDYFGYEKLKPFINFCLHYIADLDIPVKTGTFVEFRSGLINISPIGRNCSQQEREEFFKYDQIHKIREKMVAVLQEKFAHLNLKFSIGGQISFDVFPVGWDKTFCLQFLETDGFSEIHFFGDKTAPGGNDYEIFSSPKTIGHSVGSWQDTREQLKQLLNMSSN